MSTEQGAPATVAPTSNQLASARTELATARSVLAADRTLLAWIRTGLSLISFGFTIYKMLDGRGSDGGIIVEHSPRNVGLFLTGLGTFTLLMGTADYWRNLHLLRAYHTIRTWRLSFVMALIMSATGLFLFFGIIARLL